MENPGKLKGKRETMDEGLENETGRNEKRGKWENRKDLGSGKRVENHGR